MIYPVFEPQVSILDFVYSRIGYSVPPAVGIGIAEDGRLIAGVVYSQFREASIEASIAASSPRWATRKTLQTLFAYPFHQLGVRRITCVIAKRNRHSREICERLGFTPEGKLRHAFWDDDAIIYGLLKEDCRWISHGQEFQRARCA